uniref:Uncharacterized protein n=1 Tax=Oryza meridionalis TaxID=40149 RepID=A0A0E0F7G4_9ORYZ
MAMDNVSMALVEVDAIVAVLGEEPHLVHPGTHLLVVLAALRSALRQVRQEAVHALHLLLDELHVVPDTTEKSRLVADDHQQ